MEDTKNDIVINDDLGEVSDAGLSEELDLDEAGVDLAVVPEKTKHIAAETAAFDAPVIPADKELRCAICHNLLRQKDAIAGTVCKYCAFKQFRALEAELQSKKVLTTTRKYCVAEDHNEIRTNTMFPEWNSEITINGVKVYPIEPLCNNCIDILTAYLIEYLEERGIVRTGSGHTKNEFRDQLNKVLPTELLQKLQAYIAAIKIEVLDKANPANAVYRHIKETKRRLSLKKAKEEKERKRIWEEAKKPVPLPTLEYQTPQKSSVKLQTSEYLLQDDELVIRLIQSLPMLLPEFNPYSPEVRKNLEKVVTQIFPWYPAIYVEELIKQGVKEYETLASKSK